MRLMLAAGLMLVATGALAQPRSPFLTLSGELQDSVGAPVTGSVTLTVRLYANSAAPVGQELFSETFALTGVQRGRFAVKLGTAAALDAGTFDIVAMGTAGVWVGLQVMGEAEMSPRAQLTSAPWALSADWSGLTGKPATFPPSTHTHSGADVTSAVTSATSAVNAASVPWTGVTGTPATFVPTPHTHVVADVTGVLPVTKGGTGSGTQNFVDLTSTQTIGGTKTFSGSINVAGTASTIATPGWTAVTLTANQWANYGGGYAVAAYKKDPLGFVHIKGLVTPLASATTTLFVLPVGYRPSEHREFVGYTVTGGMPGANVIVIYADGTVSVPSLPLATTTELSLDNIIFQ